MTAEEKAAAVADWQSSGKTLSDYCRGLRNCNVDPDRIVQIASAVGESEATVRRERIQE